MKKLMTNSFFKMFLIALTIFIIGCGKSDSDNDGNHIPDVNIVQNSKTVVIGTKIDLTSIALDIDGDKMTYEWSFDSKPSGSTASLSTVTSKQTSFTADKEGKYKVTFEAKDSVGAVGSDTVTITATKSSTPNANVGKGAELWKYEFNDLVDTLVPALDEQGNIYFAENTNPFSDIASEKNFIVTSLTKDGKKRWSKTFTKSVGYSKIMYKNNQIYFIAKNAISIEDKFTGNTPSVLDIYTLNSSDGSTKWHKREQDQTFYDLYQGNIAVTDDRLYVYMIDTDIFGSKSQLVSYSTVDGTTKAKFEIGDAGEIGNSRIILSGMSVFNNHIYFLTPVNDKVHRVDDLSNSLVAQWSIELNTQGEYYSFVLGVSALAIDSKENVYIVTAEQQKHNSIYSISKDGQLNWKNEFVSTKTRLPSPVTIDKNDVIYSSTNSALYSVSSSTGATLWSLENATYSRIGLEQDFQLAPTIGENGKTYHKSTYGLATANKNGSLDWEFILDNNQHAAVNSEYSTLNINGNLIAIGLKAISCYQVDNTKLDSAGWSKLYGNAGNTSSR